MTVRRAGAYRAEPFAGIITFNPYTHPEAGAVIAPFYTRGK